MSRPEPSIPAAAGDDVYRSIVEAAQVGIWVIDHLGRTVFANARLAQLLGRPLEQLRAEPATAVLPDADLLLDADEDRREPRGHAFELPVEVPGAAARVLQVRVVPMPTAGRRPGVLATVTDVTEERQAEERLRRHALLDELTGLANRSLLRDRLAGALSRRDRNGGTVAVLLVDVDGFKLVNDTWGHAVGDELLQQVAARLRGAVRDSDTVARLGGDEFVVVAEQTAPQDAVPFAERVLAGLGEPFEVAGQRVHVTASVGVAVSPPYDAEDLLRYADAAMYDAKSRGRARVQIFDDTLARRSADRLELGADLDAALSGEGGGGLHVVYQPVVAIATGAVVGVEALLRWSHPRRGEVPPAEFVPVAEAAGLALPLDRWVLRQVFGDVAALRLALGAATQVALNVSAKHLVDDDLERDVVAALDVAGISPDGIVLEITETALMTDPERARAVLQRLRDRRLRLSVDDFGTGSTSLGYLQRLPVDTLKIDRTFVGALTDDPDALAIAGSIVDLARSLRLGTVAEGVESREQMLLLHRLGCTQAQGYLWSRPMPLDELVAAVRRLPQRRFPASVERGLRMPRHRAAAIVTAEHGLRVLLRLHAEGASATSIAAALNAEGFRTPQGAHWHRATVAKAIADAQALQP